MPRPAAHLSRVLAWLVAGACATHAGEVTQSWAPAADQSKLTAGAALMTDYIYRGISYSAHRWGHMSMHNTAGSTPTPTSTA
jgi:hypothetical protein